MDLEGLQIVARPRNHWEALDLGLLIARRWYRLLLTSWLCLAAPAFIACWILLPDSPVLAIFIVWWLKPLYERVPLKILSSAIFGSVPTLEEALRQSRRCLTSGMLGSLTYRRLSPNRSFEAPVMVLERLEGDVRQKRIGILHARAGSTAFWLTLLGVHIEAFLVLGLVVGVYFFIPAEFEIDWWGVVISGTSGEQDWLLNGLTFLAMAAVAPVYVSAGFALYLNRRIELEAWDIELGFKRLALRALAPLLVVACLATGIDARAVVEKPTEGDPEPVYEELLPELPEFEGEVLSAIRQESRSAIEGVLAGPEFHHETTIRCPKFMEDLCELEEAEPISEPEGAEWLLSLIRFFASIAELLLWAFVVGLVIWIVHRVGLMERLGVSGNRKRRPRERPIEILGLPVTADSLPEDVLDSAREYWRRGERRDAIGLLYRASLSALMDNYDCAFSEGDTEGDCLRKVLEGPAEAGTVFRELTRVWLFAAYAHDMPADDEFLRLCNEWPLVFDKEHNGADPG